MLTFTVVHALSVGYVPQRGLPSVATGRLAAAAGHVSMVTTLKEGTLGADLEDPMFLDEEQALQAQGWSQNGCGVRHCREGS